MATEDADAPPEPTTGAEAFEQLGFYAAQRHKELSKMLAPVITAADAYAVLIARLVWILGDVPPVDDQDRVVRDLMADAFEFLSWRRAVLEGQLNVAYPLARRAYESLSLLAVCVQDAGFSHRWQKGEKIGNVDVRKALARLPFKESEKALQELYAFFSKGSHPNRDLIPERFLGAGNGFALGSIGRPDLILTVDHCHNLLQMWAWFGAAAGYFYRRETDVHDISWGKDYIAAAANAQDVAEHIVNEYNRLLTERNAN
jgi:hypothetical protein